MAFGAAEGAGACDGACIVKRLALDGLIVASGFGLIIALAAIPWVIHVGLWGILALLLFGREKKQ